MESQIGMEYIVNLRINKLPESDYVATSADIPGLIGSGKTITRAIEKATAQAKRILQEHADRGEPITLKPAPDSFDCLIIVKC